MANKRPRTFASFAKSSLGNATYDRFIHSAGYTDYIHEDAYETIFEYGIEDNLGGWKAFSVPWHELVESMAKEIGMKNFLFNCEVTDISHADKGALSGKKKKSDHKMNRSENDNTSYSETRKVMQELDVLRSMIKTASLNETFVPNSSSHLTKWAEEMNVKNAFTSTIEDETILKIMMLEDVENSWKVLLLMGIGVFTNHESIAYTEIMKSLADQQKLYVIIASSDYIYGTNYQFCHGYLSKDMNLTQEKIIQAMGRIGRNKIQQDYSVRFRDDDQIKKLFSTESDKPEVRNMNRLFVTSE
jgi:hypothetical protein